ncbi:uncharacterized protein LOC105703496 [Orussus abietinus]|uniref:uncharacterized protein LOC105703496 n=1 Tax=Orussus abietinus TaxID=222816 RepID=UPI0006251F02|nr:uncharacterized protein LOC105703496 [Orussus abietinus]
MEFLVPLTASMLFLGAGRATGSDIFDSSSPTGTYICIDISDKLPTCEFMTFEKCRRSSIEDSEESQRSASDLKLKLKTRSNGIDEERNVLDDFELSTIVYKLEGCLPPRLPFDLPMCTSKDTSGKGVITHRIYPFMVTGAGSSEPALIFPKFEINDWLRIIKRFRKKRDSSPTISKRKRQDVFPSRSKLSQIVFGKTENKVPHPREMPEKRTDQVQEGSANLQMIRRVKGSEVDCAVVGSGVGSPADGSPTKPSAPPGQYGGGVGIEAPKSGLVSAGFPHSRADARGERTSGRSGSPHRVRELQMAREVLYEAEDPPRVFPYTLGTLLQPRGLRAVDYWRERDVNLGLTRGISKNRFLYRRESDDDGKESLGRGAEGMASLGSPADEARVPFGMSADDARVSLENLDDETRRPRRSLREETRSSPGSRRESRKSRFLDTEVPGSRTGPTEFSNGEVEFPYSKAIAYDPKKLQDAIRRIQERRHGNDLAVPGDVEKSRDFPGSPKNTRRTTRLAIIPYPVAGGA